MLKSIIKLTLGISFLGLIFPFNTYAYFDPGSGSFLIQIVVATLAGAGYFIKANWDKIKQRFNRNSKKTEDEKQDEQE
jgi:hypothetical protein